MRNKQLCKSSTNKQLAGVCGGIGEYFGIDPSIIRVLFILSVIIAGSGIGLYLILAIVLPYDYQVDNSRMNNRSNPFNTTRPGRKDVTDSSDNNDNWSDF